MRRLIRNSLACCCLLSSMMSLSSSSSSASASASLYHHHVFLPTSSASVTTSFIVRSTSRPKSTSSGSLSARKNPNKECNHHHNNNDNDNNNQAIHKNQARYRRLQELTNNQQSSTTLSKREVQELKGLRAKGDPYNANLFTADHAAFKQGHNAALIQLARYDSNGDESLRILEGTTADDENNNNNNQMLSAPPRRPVFYLDGPDGATTRALLEAGFDHATELFTANEWSETVHQLRQPPLAHANCDQGLAQDSLRTTFRHVPFVAAYLDGCGGDPAPVIDMIDALLSVPRAPNTLCIGFTLTAAAPSGRELLDRVQDVTRATLALTKQQGHYQTMVHVGDDPGRFGIDPDLVRKHDGTTTCWLACTNNIT